MSAAAERLAPHRDAGPLARRGPPPTRGVPEVVLLAAAVAALAGAAVGLLLAGAPRPEPLSAIVLVPAGGGYLLALAATRGRSLPRLDWPVPALLRALEYGLVLVLAGGGPWTFALLATLAFHHYDIVYRVGLQGVPPPRWLAVATGGWPVRCGLLLVAATLGATGPLVVVLTAVLAPILAVEAAVTWLPRSR